MKPQGGEDHSKDPEYLLIQKGNLEPVMIMDIIKEDGKFFFVIKFSSVMDSNDTQLLNIQNMGIFNEKFLFWFISKFKKNLQDLSSIKLVYQWSLVRLNLLKEYCDLIKFDYKKLNYKNIPFQYQIYHESITDSILDEEKKILQRAQAEEVLNVCCMNNLELPINTRDARSKEVLETTLAVLLNQVVSLEQKYNQMGQKKFQTREVFDDLDILLYHTVAIYK